MEPFKIQIPNPIRNNVQAYALSPVKSQLAVILTIIFSTLSWSSNKLSAQIKITGISMDATYVPKSKYTQPEGTKPTTATTGQSWVGLAMDISLSKHIDTLTGAFSSWSVGLGGTYTNLQNNNYTTPQLPDKLATASLGLVHTRSMGKRWTALYLVSAAIASDFDKIDHHDFIFNGGAAFIRRYSPRFSFGFGAFVNNAFGTPMIFPAFFVQWQTGRKIRLDIGLPDRDAGPGGMYRISGTYVFNKTTELSLVFKPRAMIYDTEIQGSKNRMLSTFQLPIGLENKWHFKNVDLVAGAGALLLNEFGFREKKLSKIFEKSPQHKLAPNYYLNLGMRWHF